MGLRPYLQSKLNIMDCAIVAVAWISGCIYIFVSKEEAQSLLAFRLLRVLRVVKLLFSNKYLAELLELAFSSARTIASLITFLFFVITLVAIMGMHMFAASCHEGQALPSASFGSFWRSVLVIFQIITIDHWGGITYYYMDCYGNGFVVTMFFSFVFVFINFVVINLFTAVFIENFELSEEMKADRQEHNALKQIAKQQAQEATDFVIEWTVPPPPEDPAVAAPVCHGKSYGQEGMTLAVSGSMEEYRAWVFDQIGASRAKRRVRTRRKKVE